MCIIVFNIYRQSWISFNRRILQCARRLLLNFILLNETHHTHAHIPHCCPDSSDLVKSSPFLHSWMKCTLFRSYTGHICIYLERHLLSRIIKTITTPTQCKVPFDRFLSVFNFPMVAQKCQGTDKERFKVSYFAMRKMFNKQITHLLLLLVVHYTMKETVHSFYYQSWTQLGSCEGTQKAHTQFTIA